MQTHIDRLTLRDGGVEGPTGRLPYAEVIAQHFGLPGGELIGRGGYRGERGALGGVAPFWEVSLAAAEVEVDTDTGQVRLQRYISIADVGKAITPCSAKRRRKAG